MVEWRKKMKKIFFSSKTLRWIQMRGPRLNFLQTSSKSFCVRERLWILSLSGKEIVMRMYCLLFASNIRTNYNLGCLFFFKPEILHIRRTFSMGPIFSFFFSEIKAKNTKGRLKRDVACQVRKTGAQTKSVWWIYRAWQCPHPAKHKHTNQKNEKRLLT